MISHYTIYDTSGGILRAIVAPSTDDISDHLDEGEHALAQTSDGGMHQRVDVESLSIIDKTPIHYSINKTLIAANASDVAIISGLPTNSIATVIGESDNETNGTVSFGVDLAGIYEITLSHPLYLDTIVTVTAT